MEDSTRSTTGLPFKSYSQLKEGGDTPYIVVDGSPEACNDKNAVLVLTHSPGNNVPHALKADLSTQIVYNYLLEKDSEEAKRLLAAGKAVTNDHFDVDGLLGCFALYDPEFALAHRDLIEAAASAGDFLRCADRNAARLSFTLEDMEIEAKKELLGLDYLAQTASLYETILPRVRNVIEDIGAFAHHWQAQDSRLEKTQNAIKEGLISIKDLTELGLTVVTVLSDSVLPDHVHPMAIHNATNCFTTLFLHPSMHHYYVNYRYESYVDYQSVSVPKRIKLTEFAAILNVREKDQGNTSAHWVYDDTLSYQTFFKLVSDTSSASSLSRSALSAEEFQDSLVTFLQSKKSSM